MFLLKKVQYVVCFICEENEMWTQIQYSTQRFVLEKLHKTCLIKFMKAPQNWRSFLHCINYSLCFSVSANLLWEVSVSLSTLLMKILANMVSVSATDRIQAHWLPPFEIVHSGFNTQISALFQNSASKWECGETWCHKTYQHRALSESPVSPHPYRQ